MSKNTIVDWNTIYNEQSGQLLGLCRRYVRDTQLAEDLVHDSFIKAIEKIDSFKGHGSLEGWLRKIVLNNTLEYLRVSKKTDFTDVDDLHIVDEKELVHDDGTTKALIKNALFSQDDLLKVIDSLPVHHKTVFNLYVIEGYSHQEICDVLDIEVSTSKSHLSRARKKIQQLLIEKASEMKKDNEHKKRKKALGALPLFGVSVKANSIDRLFKEAFANFKLPISNQTANFKKVISNSKPVRIPSKFGIFQSASRLYWGAGIAGAIVVGCIAYNEFTPNETTINPLLKPDIEQTTSPVCVEKDSLITSKEIDKENVVIEASNTSNMAVPHTNAISIEPAENNESTTTNTVEATINTSSETVEPDTIKKEPIIVRKQVVVRKTVVIDENK